MQQLQPNTTLQGGKYRIEHVLGQGGFGNTYYGYNTVFNEPVAIKEFFMQGINDRDASNGAVSVSIEGNKPQFEEQLEKFKKEARRIRQLKNEHIVAVHDLFEENGTAYYVMDYVDGENLAERLKRTGKPMTETEVRELLPQILDALKTVHEAGIWHLDLKPANIMMDKAGNVSLIDFGASKQLNAQKGGATTSTAISYTNGYAPMEQLAQDFSKFGPWTDIYALGATLYSLLTNKRPPLPTDIDDDISEDKHVVLSFSDNISDDMKQMVLWMMKTNRMQRPQRISDLEHILYIAPTNEQEITLLDAEVNIHANSRIREEAIIEQLIHKAKNGDAKAQFALGSCYDKGKCVEKDDKKAFEWYKKSAEQGNAYAQNKIGECYYYGRGTEEDKQKALEWFEKSAEQGCMPTIGWLNNESLLAVLEIKANEGYDVAQKRLGDWYYNGINVKKNKRMAHLWYFAAAEQGNIKAKAMLKEMNYKRNIKILWFLFVGILISLLIINPILGGWIEDIFGGGVLVTIDIILFLILFLVIYLMLKLEKNYNHYK